MRKLLVHNWTSIFAFWEKKTHAALLVNFYKWNIAIAESALFKKKKKGKNL